MTGSSQFAGARFRPNSAYGALIEATRSTCFGEAVVFKVKICLAFESRIRVAIARPVGSALISASNVKFAGRLVRLGKIDPRCVIVSCRISPAAFNSGAAPRTLKCGGASPAPMSVKSS